MSDRKRIPIRSGCNWWTNESKGKFLLMGNDYVSAEFKDKKACEVFERDFSGYDIDDWKNMAEENNKKEQDRIKPERMDHLEKGAKLEIPNRVKNIWNKIRNFFKVDKRFHECCSKESPTDSNAKNPFVTKRKPIVNEEVSND